LVSTDERAGDEHYSLSLQEERCREYAKSRGWHVLKVRTDVASGRDADGRPSYMALLRDIDSGEIDGIIVYRLDRLSRNVRDVYDFLGRTDQAGIGFASTSEAFDTTTAMGRALLGVAAVFAQLTREMIGENSKDGLAKRAAAGKYNGCKNPAPYGYDYTDGRLVVNNEQAAVVRRMFDTFAHQGKGVTAIAGRLNREAVPGNRGGQWSRSQVRRMLISRLYLGEVTCRGEWLDETQALIAQRSQLPSRSHQSQHLLSGIVQCGKCGRLMQAHWLHTQSSRTKGRKRYRTYLHRITEFVGETGCRGVSKSAAKLEAAVLERIREAAASADFQEAAFAEARRQLAKDLPAAADEREQIESQLSGLDRRFDLWAQQLEAGSIDDVQFRKRNEALLKEKAGLQERLASLGAKEAEAESLEMSLGQVREALKDFDRVWEHLTIDEQREMLRALVEHLKVWKDKAELKLVLMPPVEIPLVFRRGPTQSAGS